MRDGLGAIAGSAYGERIDPADDLDAAERAIAQTLLWHLRILAGWLPRPGVDLLRALAARFELANIDARLAALRSGKEPPPFELGGLAIAWPRLERARTIEEIREGLGRSPWGDPGGRSAADVTLGLRASWAQRVRAVAPAATADWVTGAAALLVARELLVAGGRDHAAQLRRLPGVDERALHARSLDDLRATLPAGARWALEGIGDTGDLWRAELGWWGRVERDAAALRRSRDARDVLLAVTAMLAADAERTARAVRVAARGGSGELVGGAA